MPSKDKLFRVALSLLGNRQEAEDTLQDACLKLWSMRDRLDEYESVEALAVTMTKNLCLDKVRSYRHRKLNHADTGTMMIRSDAPDPGEKAELTDSLRAVRNIIATLPAQQKLILHLRDVEQYSYEEIREMTGLTVNNIRVSLSRARKNVRRAYLKREDYDENRTN